jgi:tetratricopeptide (TPR) repeat protein
MKLFSKSRKTTVLLIASMSILITGFSVASSFFRKTEAKVPQNQALQLLSQASPAPWSRTERDLSTLQELVRANPMSGKNHTRLGQTYLQKTRETGDPSFLTKAEMLFKRALELDGRDFEAMAGMGSLNLSRHHFWEAMRWADKGLAINPWSSELYGIMGDAYVELGEYEKAVKAFQKMVDLKPQLSSYSRVSYMRELHGDVEGAIEAMKMAVSSGTPSRESTAWCQVQLGNLFFNRGDLRSAEMHYESALRNLPQYVHAKAGLAKVRAAQGKLEEALRLYEQVVSAMPLPEYVIAFGDLYEAQGDQEAAKHQYDLVRAMQDLYRANGVDAEMEMALFEADHDLNIGGALEQARKQIQKQPNIKASDVLAWTLYKAGQYEQAESAIRQALRLGTRDPLFLFHAGMIYYKGGHKEKAGEYLTLALKLNPQFSIRHAAEAKRILRELRQST